MKINSLKFIHSFIHSADGSKQEAVLSACKEAGWGGGWDFPLESRDRICVSHVKVLPHRVSDPKANLWNFTVIM